MRRIAQILSALFHPLMMVTYGMILAVTCTYMAVFPATFKWLLVGMTFLTTAFLPGGAIALLAKTGVIQDQSLDNRRERVLPYLFYMASLLCCLYFYRRMMMPFWMMSLLVGTLVAMGITLLVNFVWKISAHCIGIGGLLGGLMGVARIYHLNPYPGLMAWILLAGMLATSRLYLEKHTPTQVYIGFFLGFICTFASSIVSYIYLFI